MVLGNLDPGHLNMVSLSATKLNADEDIRKIEPKKRNCYFSDELQQIQLHNRYSQANCLFECALHFAQNLLMAKQNDSTICTPWFFPFLNKDQRMCNPWEKADIMETIKVLLSTTFYEQLLHTKVFEAFGEKC